MSCGALLSNSSWTGRAIGQRFTWVQVNHCTSSILAGCAADAGFHGCGEMYFCNECIKNNTVSGALNTLFSDYCEPIQNPESDLLWPR